MKSIELVKRKETISAGETDREIEFDTRDLIKMALNNPPEKGFDVSEMKSRIRVLDTLENVNGETVLNLEDADYTILGNAVKSMRWAILSKSVLEFATQFDS